MFSSIQVQRVLQEHTKRGEVILLVHRGGEFVVLAFEFRGRNTQWMDIIMSFSEAVSTESGVKWVKAI